MKLKDMDILFKVVPGQMGMGTIPEVIMVTAFDITFGDASTVTELTLDGYGIQHGCDEAKQFVIAINDSRYMKVDNDWIWIATDDKKEKVKNKKQIELLERCYKNMVIVNTLDRL